MIRNANLYEPKEETRGRKPAMSPHLIKRVVRLAKQEPFKSAVQLKSELDVSASVETVRRRLREDHLNARRPRKVPLLRSCHVAKRLLFARNHVDWPVQKWRNVLWTDESKIVLFGGVGSRCYVRRPPNKEFNPAYTTKTVKHGGCSIMVWGCFSYHGVGPIYWIKSILDQHLYVKIMEEVMLPFASEEMPLRWVFQQDNDPKHTSKTAKRWFEEKQISVMEWPPQSPDLNPLENLWADVKKGVSEQQPSNINDLWSTIQRCWSAIPLQRYQSLVNSMPRRCKAVISNKGYATKY